MAVFAIPNPKKELSVDFPIDRVKASVKNISLINPQYKLNSCNEIFNQYTFESYEFLSLGVFIDVNLNALSENKTEITIEIRRKIGTFNESHEVTNANNHIVKIVNHIAYLIAMSDEDILKLKMQQTQKVYNSSQNMKSYKDKNLAAILAFLVGGLGIHRFYLGQPILGILYLLFCWTFIPLFIAVIDFFVFIFISKNSFNLKYNK